MSTRPNTKIPSGIPGFDTIAEGGIPEGALTLLSGTAGSAKTVFAVQFLAAGILEYKESAVLITFEERPMQMRRHMLSLGWDIEQWERDNTWAFVDATPYTDEEQIHIGSYNLEALLTRIQHAIQKVGAKRVAIDSLGTMFAQIPDPQILRSELFRIIQELQKLSVTSIITAERFSEREDISRYGIEEFVADNVIILRHVREGDKRRRTVEILKYRGTTYQNGEFPFTILKNQGIEVISLSTETVMQSAPLERTTSGNGTLDDMCGGGLLRSSIVLISGATGTGKTLTTTQFIGAGGAQKERCLFLAFEESAEQIFRNAKSWGFDFESQRQEGFLRLISSYPESASLNDHFVRIKMTIDAYKPQRVAIDSLSALERVSSPRAFREFIINLSAFLKERGILTICTSTTPALLGGASITEAHISTITDSIILLRYVEIFGEMRRGVMVLKMRGSNHKKEIREFIINDHGMVIGKAFQNVIGIISGNASIVATNDEISRVDKMFAGDES